MSYYETTPVYCWDVFPPENFYNFTNFKISDDLRASLKEFREHLDSATWKENCRKDGRTFNDNQWSPSDAEKLGAVYSMQTDARHLLTQKGIVNYIRLCFNALCRLQASLRTDGWFFQFLSTPHQNVSSDVRQLFQNMANNVTALNTMLAWNGLIPPYQDTSSYHWKFETNANDRVGLLEQLHRYA